MNYTLTNNVTWLPNQGWDTRIHIAAKFLDEDAIAQPLGGQAVGFARREAYLEIPVVDVHSAPRPDSRPLIRVLEQVPQT